MKIVIIGAGEVGGHLSEVLSNSGHDVTVIEHDDQMAAKIHEEQNVRVLRGNGSSAKILHRAKAGECSYFLAMTSDDQVNLVSGSIAKKMGAETTIARIHEETYIDNKLFNYQLNFGIDLLVNPEALAAVELAKVIRNPGRVAVEHFARGKIEVQQIEVTAKAKAIGRNLKQLRLGEKTGVRIGLIRRRGSFLVPGAETVIEEGDRLTMFGDPQSLSEIKGKFSPKLRARTVFVALYGGSETNIALLRMLSNPRFHIRLIEPNRKICQNLAEQFPHITVVHGDATSLRVLEEERVGRADYFVAATKADEDNVMACLQTAQMGTKRLLLNINRSDYSEIINKFRLVLGIELAVSPRLATANEVLRTVNQTPWVELAPAPGGKGKIVELRVNPESPCVGKPIKDLRLPGNTIIVALMHKFDAKVPGAGDVIIADDRIVAVLSDEHRDEVISLLTGGEF